MHISAVTTALHCTPLLLLLQVCSTRVARKVTYDDRAAPHSPFFWCEECFMLMHYDQQVSTEEHRRAQHQCGGVWVYGTGGVGGDACALMQSCMQERERGSHCHAAPLQMPAVSD